MKTLGAIILAAGKGTRMKMAEENKVVVPLANKPMIQYIVDFMYRIQIRNIVVVVGFAKESVIKALSKYQIVYADQGEPLGTGHALVCGLESLPPEVEDVLVVYGDDAVLYSEKNTNLIKNLFEMQDKNNAAITFLTIEMDNPFALGRIVRNKDNKVIAIVEEKDASDEQKKITEINPGCFVFSVKFLKKYKSHITKSPVSGEYYINNFIDLAIQNGETVQAVNGGKINWRGVNTEEELKEANMLIINS